MADRSSNRQNVRREGTIKNLTASRGKPSTSGRSRAFRVAKRDLMPFIERNPKVAIAIIQELAQRLERANDHLG